MINIQCYISDDDETLKKSPEFKVLQLVNDKEFRNQLKDYHKVELITTIFYVESKFKDIENFEVRAILNSYEDLLPIVTLNGDIIAKGRLLTVNEFSEILGVGLAIQTDEI